jgi:hypothetical protein
VNWIVFCGSGFPAATIEAESLSHKNNLLADNLTPGVMARLTGKSPHDTFEHI